MQILRPTSGTGPAGSWVAVGAPTLHQAVSDDSDATYIENSSAGNIVLYPPNSGELATWTKHTGNRLYIRHRIGSEASQAQIDLLLQRADDGTNLVIVPNHVLTSQLWTTLSVELTTQESQDVVAQINNLRFKVNIDSITGLDSYQIADVWAEFNEPAPSVTQIDQTNLIVGHTYALQVTGTGFHPLIQVSGGESSGIDVVNVVWVSETMLQLTVFVRDAGDGTIMFENPDAQSDSAMVSVSFGDSPAYRHVSNTFSLRMRKPHGR